MYLLKQISLFISLTFLSLDTLYAQSDEALAQKTLIVANQNEPNSLEIARYYAQRRGIPATNIIRLDLSNKETITIKEYVETVANPLLNILLDNKWVKGVKSSEMDRYGRERLSISVHEIPYLVLVKGVPLRISNNVQLIEPEIADQVQQQLQCNNASVDSELTLLLGPSGLSMTAFVPNPFFNKSTISAADANRLLRVSRLDGPSKENVIRLIDRTLEAEEIGLMGRAYIDQGGPHQQGDEWIAAAGEMLESAYFDVDYEKTKRLMDMSDRLDAPALYFGWYSPNPKGPWAQQRWPVPPGAIAFHLHSFSGTSLRGSNTWLGAFISQGYCATVGNVYEPYLDGTHRPHILLAHLLSGGRFGDAVMLSQATLSWQNVAIGDPLYRPFKVALEAQLRSSTETSFASYVSIREINRMLAENDVEAALSFARSKFMSQPSLALAYRLAQIYGTLGKDREAVEVLKIIRYISVFSADEYVLVQKIANFLHNRGESMLALTLYKSLLGERNLDKQLRVSLLESGAPIAKSEGDTTTSSRWLLEARQLK